MRDQIKAILNKERSARLEGSFGNQKEHYGLGKIKARTPLTQILWLFLEGYDHQCSKYCQATAKPTQTSRLKELFEQNHEGRADLSKKNKEFHISLPNCIIQGLLPKNIKSAPCKRVGFIENHSAF